MCDERKSFINLQKEMDQPGLYSIGLMVNGGFYEKKFKVEH